MRIHKSQPIADLLDFFNLWLGPCTSRHGVPGTKIPGLVPPPLHAVYKAVGNRPIPYDKQWRPPHWRTGLLQKQDRLRAPDQLEVKNDRLIFLDENQGVWHCEVPLGRKDPPVFVVENADCLAPTEREAARYLSRFLVTFCLQELVVGTKLLYYEDGIPEQFNGLTSVPLSPLWLGDSYVHGPAWRQEYYMCGDDVLVLKQDDLEQRYWYVFVAFKSKQATHKLAREFKRPTK